MFDSTGKLVDVNLLYWWDILPMLQTSQRICFHGCWDILAFSTSTSSPPSESSYTFRWQSQFYAHWIQVIKAADNKSCKMIMSNLVLRCGSKISWTCSGNLLHRRRPGESVLPSRHSNNDSSSWNRSLQSLAILKSTTLMFLLGIHNISAPKWFSANIWDFLNISRYL